MFHRRLSLHGLLAGAALVVGIALVAAAPSDAHHMVSAPATRLSILSGSMATADGNVQARAGWFDLAQTDRFVFAQPALTNVNPAIAYAPAETLSGRLPGLATWQPSSTRSRFTNS